MTKPASFSFAALSMFCTALYTSTDSLAHVDWSEYYPMHNGNFWEYEETVNNIMTTATREILGDSIFANGNTYKLIRRIVYDGPYPDTSFSFERLTIDGVVLTPTPFGCDDTLYVLFASVNDSFRVSCPGMTSLWWLLSSKSEQLVFDDTVCVMRWDLTGGPFPIQKHLAEGIGLIIYSGEGDERFLRGAVINGVKHGEITVSVQVDKPPDDISFYFNQNYPNPFNSETTISYSLVRDAYVSLTIFDLEGRVIMHLYEGFQRAGGHSIVWGDELRTRRQVSSGVYYARLTSEKKSRTIKLMLIK